MKISTRGRLSSVPVHSEWSVLEVGTRPEEIASLIEIGL